MSVHAPVEGEPHMLSSWIRSAEELIDFAKKDWATQRGIITWWIRYATVLDTNIPHNHREQKRRIFVLPGTEYLICKNAMAKLIGFGRDAWQNCKSLMLSGNDVNIKHGQAGRKPNNHRPEVHEAMHQFFEKTKLFAQPRATVFVKNMIEGVMAEDDSVSVETRGQCELA
jgi:hypothetical protein